MPSRGFSSFPFNSIYHIEGFVVFYAGEVQTPQVTSAVNAPLPPT